MAQGLEQGVPVADAPQLRPGAAAAGDDDPVGPEGFLPGGDGEAALAPAYRRHRVARPDFHARGFQGEAQHIQHGVGGVGQGIDPPGLVRRGGEQTQVLKQGQGVRRGQGVQRRTHKIRVRPVVMGRPGVPVCQIAPAVAGGQQLPAHPGLPLQQHHPVVRGPGRRISSHQPGGPAADDRDCFHRFLRCGEIRDKQ